MMNPEKLRLASIFKNVCDDIDNGYYRDQNENSVKFRFVSKLKSGTILFPESELLEQIPLENLPYFPNTSISVENIDTFEKAKEFGDGVAVLNMASAKNPGGGVIHGSRAQEEELCRRSNLILSLYGVYGAERFGFNIKDFDYPIPSYSTIYTPFVNVYREPKTYNTLDNPYLVNVISASMIIRPKLDENGDIEKKYVHIVRKKIRSVLRTAIKRNNSKLVLGAWGCGAYGCPSKHMARIFKRVLDEEEFKHSFSDICFAILEDHNSTRLDNPEGNFKPFKDLFG